MPTLPLLTRSLRLRHFTPEDAATNLVLNAEPSTRRWLPSHVYADLDEAVAATAYLIRCCTTPGDPRLAPYVLGVDERASGRLIGHVGFSPFEGEVEVSFAIAEAVRGRGLGSEALEAGCRWMFDAFALPCVVALTEADNGPSRSLLQRAGFVHLHDESRRFQGQPADVSWYRLAAPPPTGRA